MEKVSIIYNQALSQIQGINYVNNSFVQGQNYFIENELELRRVYGADGFFICKGQDRMSTIGANIGTASYVRQRKIRTFLRKMLSSDFLLGALVKYYFNFLLNARKSVDRYLTSGEKDDYIIFQDFFSAAYYFQHKAKEDNAKTLLILHCSNDPLEQFIPLFKGMCKYKRIENKVRKRLNYAITNVDKVVFLSQHALEASPLDINKKAYVFNGIEDISNVCISDTGDVVNLVTVASAIAHKGQSYVIRAFSRLPEKYKNHLHYYVIGGGTEFPQYKKLVEELNVQSYVTLMGPRNDVSELLKKMDVFILPSISEGMPMSIIEAMRQGLYIMATPVGGIPEMIKPDYGQLIKRNDLFIANDLIRIVDEKRVTKEAKVASRRSYETNFTLKGMINSYSKILKSL